jgi:hypothetical protein
LREAGANLAQLCLGNAARVFRTLALLRRLGAVAACCGVLSRLGHRCCLVSLGLRERHTD